MGLPTSLPGPVAQPPSETAEIYTQKPLVGFATRGVQPPSIVYVTINDYLHLTAYTTMTGRTITCSYRVLAADGQIKYGGMTLSPQANASRADAYETMPEGFLLSASLTVNSGVLSRGQVWCELDITHGPPALAVDQQPLFSDYILSGATWGWPGGRQAHPIDGPGHSYSSPASAGGANFPQPFGPSTNRRWRVVSGSVGLTTSATAGNRQVAVQVWDSIGVQRIGHASPVLQPASTTFFYVFGNVPFYTPAGGTQVVIPLEPDVFLEQAAVIETVDIGFLAGDAWTAGVIYVEEWILPTS